MKTVRIILGPYLTWFFLTMLLNQPILASDAKNDISHDANSLTLFRRIDIGLIGAKYNMSQIAQFDYISLVLDQAGIKYNIIDLSFNRLLRRIKENKHPSCASEFYKTEEREKIFKFSIPTVATTNIVIVYRKQGLMAKDLPKNSDDLFTSNFIFVRNINASYGRELDLKIKTFKPKTYLAQNRYDSLNQIAFSKKADYTVHYESEIKHLISTVDRFSDLSFYSLTDFSTTPPQYLMCNQVTSDSLLNRIAIAAESVSDQIPNTTAKEVIVP